MGWNFSLIFLFFFIPNIIFSQYYEVDCTIPVSSPEKVFTNPWVGGLDAGQYSTMDVNFDGKDDLIIFDRASSKLNVFINQNNQYIYQPSFISQFPNGLNNWVLLRDANNDGKKDIFTRDPLGIKLYLNTSTDNKLSWRVFNDSSPMSSAIKTTGLFSGEYYLQINGSDLPLIDDIDGDGDVDILVFKYSSSNTIEFHKNMSLENDGTTDSLRFKKITETYGNIVECDCNLYVFGERCASMGGRVSHQSGKSLLVLDYDGDGKRDLIVGEQDCSTLSVIYNNTTDEQNPTFNRFSNQFPNSKRPINLYQFPTPYYEDIDFDGIKDLIVTPSLSTAYNYNTDFEHSNWFYKNMGTNDKPQFVFQKNDVIQSSMLDFGQNAAPAFYDYDNDGDTDLFVGSFFSNLNNYSSRVRFFENVGTPSLPNFSLKNDDYFGFSNTIYYNIKPHFIDINADKTIDFLFSATSKIDGQTALYFVDLLKNQSFHPKKQLIFNSFIMDENISFYDINKDGLVDLLVGKANGKLEYYQNNSTNDNFQFDLIDDTFLGFTFSPFRQNISVDFSDLDADGMVDMIAGDARGNVTYHSDVFSQYHTFRDGITDIVKNGDDNLFQFNVGGGLIPKIVNIFNEDKPSIVFGTGQGGMMIFRSALAQSNYTDRLIKIFPNPVKFIKKIEIFSQFQTHAKVVDMLGNVVIKDINLTSNEVFSLNISNLKEGLYLLIPTICSKEQAIKFIVID